MTEFGQGVVWGTLKKVGVDRGGVGDTEKGGCGQGWCGGH